MQEPDYKEKFSCLKRICDKNRIRLTYEDPDTEPHYLEAIHDLEETLQTKGIIPAGCSVSSLQRFAGKKGGTNGSKRNPVGRTGRTSKKVLSVHGSVYAAVNVRRSKKPLART